jgi:hypothetical protein
MAGAGLWLVLTWYAAAGPSLDGEALHGGVDLRAAWVLAYVLPGVVVGAMAPLATATRASALQGGVLGLLLVPALPVVQSMLDSGPVVGLAPLLYRGAVGAVWCTLGALLGHVLRRRGGDAVRFVHRLRTGRYVIGALVSAVVSFVLGFFLAGAIAFPWTTPYYRPRAWLTLGLMYGTESVLRLGHITTCGFLSGNCSEHTVRSFGMTLWAILFIVFFFAFILAKSRRLLRDG